MNFKIKCQKCKKEFLESQIDISHDIPKYLVGTDLDGRHHLCKEHHKEYDLLILINCLKFVNEELISEEEISSWQKDLSKQPENIKIEFRKIARKVKEEFFDG